VTLAVTHAYGPGDDIAKLISAPAGAFVANRPTFDVTPGRQERDVVHIDDVVSAFLAVLERFDASPLAAQLEVGTGRATSIRSAG
jgi:CDP-paratose synthetase